MLVFKMAKYPASSSKQKITVIRRRILNRSYIDSCLLQRNRKIPVNIPILEYLRDLPELFHRL